MTRQFLNCCKEETKNETNRHFFAPCQLTLLSGQVKLKRAAAGWILNGHMIVVRTGWLFQKSNVK